MIPILYDSTETAYTSNGLGRLRDCIKCEVTEERNGVFECDFDYPADGAHFEDIICGRTIGVTHDDTGKIQPFDIVSYTRPIDGVVSFHCVHISYRQNGLTVQTNPAGINSLADAFARLETAQPSNPFIYSADFTSSGYMAAADGIPRTVRQMLGGVEGSILDTYGGEFEWDRFNVKLKRARGEKKDFAIRYGLNMSDYQEETDFSGSFNSCIPYYASGDDIVVGYKTGIGLPQWAGRDICQPLDLTDKFETKPTRAELSELARSILASREPHLPKQSIDVDFIRLQDTGEYEQFENLLQCKLCDSIEVIFPRYNMRGTYKIVKTVWDALKDRYISLELGALSTTLSEALGITGESVTLGGGGTVTPEDYVIEEDTDTTAYGVWHYRKWNSGRVEAWGKFQTSSAISTSSNGGYASDTITPPDFPSGLFSRAPHVQASVYGSILCWPVCTASPSSSSVGSWRLFRASSSTSTANKMLNFYCIGD